MYAPSRVTRSTSPTAGERSGELIEMFRDEPDDFRRRSATREYPQAIILQSLQVHGAFSNWAFLGGTALAVKIELDTNPPAGANTETRVVRR